MEYLRRRWPLVFLVLVPLLVLGPILLRCEAIGPFDQVRQMAPWNGPVPSQPWDVVQADGVLQFYAWRDLVFTSWAKGVVPAWNPYALAGTPLLANSQSGGLYPPHVVLGLLRVPTGFAMLLLAWIHLAWAGLGLNVLVRRLGGSELGGVVAGALFALSPFMLSWAALPSVITTVSWIPWVLAGVCGQLVVEAPTNRSRLGLAASVAMMFLAGHLQFAAYGAMAAVLFAASLIVPVPKGLGRKVSVLLLLIGLGGMLAAPQLIPVLRFGEFSHRRNVPTDDGYKAYAASAVPVTDFVSRIANPLGQGDPTEKIAADAPFSSFWPALSRRGANYAESALTLGPLALLLICVGVATRPQGRKFLPLAVILAFAFLVAIGTPLTKALYFGVPGWSSTGSPARVLSLFVLAGCGLAGLGVPDFPVADRKRLLLGMGAGSVLSLASLMPLIDAVPGGLDPEAWTVISGAAASGVPVFLLCLGLAAIGGWSLVAPKDYRALALIVPIIMSGAVVARLVRSGNPSFLHERPIALDEPARVAIVNGPWDLTTAAPALYPPNTASVARIHDLAGYDSLLHRDTVASMNAIDGEDPAPPANGNMMFVKAKADPAALAEAGVSEVWSRRPLDQIGEPVGVTSGVYRYRINGPGRVSSEGGTPKIESEDLNSIQIRATGPGRLTLRERNAEGWSATIDGKPATIESGPWRVVSLPAGEHEVTFRYSPPGMSMGILLAVVSGVVLVGLCVLSQTRKKAVDNLAGVSAE